MEVFKLTVLPQRYILYTSTINLFISSITISHCCHFRVDRAVRFLWDWETNGSLVGACLTSTGIQTSLLPAVMLLSSSRSLGSVFTIISLYTIRFNSSIMLIILYLGKWTLKSVRFSSEENIPMVFTKHFKNAWLVVYGDKECTIYLCLLVFGTLFNIALVLINQHAVM